MASTSNTMYCLRDCSGLIIYSVDDNVDANGSHAGSEAKRSKRYNIGPKLGVNKGGLFCYVKILFIINVFESIFKQQ